MDQTLKDGFSRAIQTTFIATDKIHINRGGIDYALSDPLLKPTIANNLTTSTSGSTLDARQGVVVKTGLDFAMNAALILFKYDSPWTLVLATLDLEVTIPDGDIQLPNKTSFAVTGTSGTIVNGGGLKLTYTPSTNTFTYTFVSDLSTVTEGSDANDILIAKNIAGELITGNASLTAAIDPKQDLLVSGTNIKTINSTTLLGSGDLAVEVAGAAATAETNAKAYADGLVVGLLDDRGNYDASVNTFPASGGSGTAGAILKGDLWYISVAGALGGIAVNIGDSVRALVDTPGQTATNWDILESNIGYVPENSSNKVTSISGSSTDVQYPSAKLVYDQLALKAPTTSPTFATAITGSFLTASELVGTDADKKIVSLPVADYPSPDELKFVKGVTSAIQTQIDKHKVKSIQLACSDETTALTAGTAKITFRMPFAMTLTAVRASVTTAATGATLLTVDINESGTTILSTKLTFDASEKTTTTAATPAVISDASLADDAEITIDIDSVGNTIAGAGLKVTLIGYIT